MRVAAALLLAATPAFAQQPYAQTPARTTVTVGTATSRPLESAPHVNISP